MITHSEELELSSSVLRGSTVSIDHHNSQAILRAEQRNPQVAFEIYAEEAGTLSGMSEVLALLKARLPSANSEVNSLDDGETIHPGETLISVVAPFSTFGIYRDVMTGILSSCIGWATAAEECVVAAGATRVMVNGSPYLHPEVVPAMEYSAYIGGCVAVATPEGGERTETTPQGSMTQDFVLIWGAASRAITVYDRHSRVGAQRVVPIPTTGDAIQEALDAAYALSGGTSNPLRGVQISMPANLGGGSPALAVELQSRMRDAGFTSVDLHIAGDLTPDVIAEYEASEAQIGLYIVGAYIAKAPPLGVSAAIKEIDGKAVAQRGTVPGRVPNSRMFRRELG